MPEGGALAIAKHMGLAQRKVFTLMAALHDAARRHAPGQRDVFVKQLCTHLEFFAEAELKEPKNAVPLGDFVAASVAKGEELVLGWAHTLELSPSGEFRSVLDALSARVAALGCYRLRGGPPIASACNGGPRDKEFVAASGGCIAEIKRAFDDGLSLARELYRDRAALRFPEPRVVLSTEFLARPTSLIEGKSLSLNAQTSYPRGEAPSSKVSEVSVRVAALHLRDECMATLPYLLKHELVCHAFQMANLEGGRANPGALVDPLSEGWMDWVVAKLMELRAPPPGVEFLDARQAMELHLYRANPSGGFPQAIEVCNGVTAASLVYALLKAKHKDKPNAEALAFEDFLDFSAALNAAGWGNKERSEGVTILIQKLSVKPRDQALAEAIWSFERGGDVGAVLGHLTPAA